MLKCAFRYCYYLYCFDKFILALTVGELCFMVGLWQGGLRYYQSTIHEAFI